MIYCSHGIVKDHCINKHCHKYFLDLEKFEKYIRNRKEKYVSLNEAINGKGDAFTIDDSTYAALKAAKLLVKYNHKVTLFINPYYIVNNITYWCIIINYILDTNKLSELELRGKSYQCNSYTEQVVFISKLKEYVSSIPEESDRIAYISKVFNLDLSDIVDKMPDYLKTITEDDIVSALQDGVDIQNHGWSHRQLKYASLEEINREIFCGKNWLLEKFNIDSRYYAVPFGERSPPINYNFSDIDCWFLLLYNKAIGFNGSKIYNRYNFSI